MIFASGMTFKANDGTVTSEKRDPRLTKSTMYLHEKGNEDSGDNAGLKKGKCFIV